MLNKQVKVVCANQQIKCQLEAEGQRQQQSFCQRNHQPPGKTADVTVQNVTKTSDVSQFSGIALIYMHVARTCWDIQVGRVEGVCGRSTVVLMCNNRTKGTLQINAGKMLTVAPKCYSEEQQISRRPLGSGVWSRLYRSQSHFPSTTSLFLWKRRKPGCVCVCGGGLPMRKMALEAGWP